VNGANQTSRQPWSLKLNPMFLSVPPSCALFREDKDSNESMYTLASARVVGAGHMRGAVLAM
jgi:hypothetical protein